MPIHSYGYSNALAGKNLNIILGPGGNSKTVLTQLVDDDLHDFVNVLHRFLASVSPRSRSAFLKRRAICVPPVGVGFHDHSECVGLHEDYCGFDEFCFECRLNEVTCQILASTTPGCP